MMLFHQLYLLLWTANIIYISTFKLASWLEMLENVV